MKTYEVPALNMFNITTVIVWFNNLSTTTILASSAAFDQEVATLCEEIRRQSRPPHEETIDGDLHGMGKEIVTTKYL